MRIAVLSDIHANREAFEAALAAADRGGYDQLVLLGDIVGYGPDPQFAIEAAARRVEDGAVCLLGNHDEAALAGAQRDMNENARTAITWTRTQLSPGHLDFLRVLPLFAEIDGALFVHASAHAPSRWNYVLDVSGAAESLAATAARLTVCGHTHVPAIFYGREGYPPSRFKPVDNVAAPLSAARRHVVVAGSVGQPRDGNPAACLAVIETGRSVTMQRVPYAFDTTARKIAAAALPAWLGMRLGLGR